MGWLVCSLDGLLMVLSADQLHILGLKSLFCLGLARWLIGLVRFR